MNKIKYLSDHYRPNDKYKIIDPQRVTSKVEFFNDATGARIWEPLHNKTVIAGSALTAMKLFNLDRNVLESTPTYDKELNNNDAIPYGSSVRVIEGADGTTYPTVAIKNANGDVIGSVHDETQRIICGFCVGQGGAGLDISDVFEVQYCSWISPDNLVPFRYPLVSADNVDESMYKGKTELTLNNGQIRHAYYFKEFSNSPRLEQNYMSTVGTFTDSISSSTVYKNTASADAARSYVECHLKITRDDCREFFIAHKGLENAKINQISLVSAWKKTVEVTKMNSDGNSVTNKYEYLQDIRPFSLLNIPNEILSDMEKSISIIYTLYF